MEKTIDIFDHIAVQVERLMEEKALPYMVFHNIGHTLEMVKICEKIAIESDVEAENLKALKIAALFYDAGFYEDYKNPIESSIELASNYLKKTQYNALVALVTQILQEAGSKDEPQSLPGKILADALTAYFGRKRYDQRQELLQMEQSTAGLFPKDSKVSWTQQSLEVLLQHRYFTPYARKKYQPRKYKNLLSQKKDVQKEEKYQLRKNTGKEFGRGVDSLYRISFRNHINLSSIADGKANMMISINTIVLSIMVGLSGAGITVSTTFQDNPKFLIPFSILLLGALGSVIFAILSTRPKITQKKLNQESLGSKTKSPLYFGNFLTIGIDKFVTFLEDLKQDQDLLYDNLAKDLYHLGLVLDRKYKLLKISYDIFMVALVLGVLSVLPILWFN